MTNQPVNVDVVQNGDRCRVTGGVHRGRAGTVEDFHLSKSGHATITVREDSGARFKTLARNVEVLG